MNEQNHPQRGRGASRVAQICNLSVSVKILPPRDDSPVAALMRSRSCAPLVVRSSRSAIWLRLGRAALYRGIAFCGPLATRRTPESAEPDAGGKSATQQIGNLRYVMLAALLTGCAHAPVAHRDAPVLRYTGSSTIAHFIRDAEPAYGKVRFTLDTAPESAGGERALLSGETDLAGVAARPSPAALSQGVQATLLGQDAIAVVVNQSNPVTGLTRAQLRDVFTGKIQNWKELGGPDLAIRPCIVGPASATRKVFRSAVLGEADYAGCELAQPDSEMPMKVEAEAGAIGHVSFAFLGQCDQVKALAVDGQPPSPANASYPISRPLYLLWWPGRAQVADFISWTRSAEARAILLKRFALPGPADQAQTTNRH